MGQKIKTQNEQVYKTQKVAANCRSITFEIQTGSAPCSIDDYPLVINRPYSINLYPGELNVSNYQVTWGSPGTKVLYITRELEVK